MQTPPRPFPPAAAARTAPPTAGALWARRAPILILGVALGVLVLLLIVLFAR